jgi:hypothetical protein
MHFLRFIQKFHNEKCPKTVKNMHFSQSKMSKSTQNHAVFVSSKVSEKKVPENPRIENFKKFSTKF